jgi:hypothetical protein
MIRGRLSRTENPPRPARRWRASHPSREGIWEGGVGSVVLLLSLFSLCLLLSTPASAAADSLCATVKLQVQQDLTLERQGFEARMRIANGFETLALDAVGVTLRFADSAGEAVIASTNAADPNPDVRFFIGAPAASGVSGHVTAGSGSIAPGTTADIRWLLVPTACAGGTTPAGRTYEIGARLTYRVGAESNRMDVIPDTILVKPLPALRLDYFLPGAVYGDDPLTLDQVEPIVPFTLGVRVCNVGYGTARALKMDGMQPEIRRNDNGLPIEFIVTGSEVNGRAGGADLSVAFGDLAPAGAGCARWTMTCLLYGTFTNCTARFAHADDLGGELTSLIAASNLHARLALRDVLDDRPGRDAVRDFLVPDMRLYGSDGGDSAVSNMSAAAVLTPEPEAYRLELPGAPLAGCVYVCVANPAPTNRVLDAVVRSDGKRLRPENAWTARVRDGEGAWRERLRVFDADAGGQSYTVRFADRPPENEPPVLAPIGGRSVRPGIQAAIAVQADDDTAVPALSTGPLPAGASFADRGDGSGAFDWTPAAGQIGDYRIRFTASDGVLAVSETVVVRVSVDGSGAGPAGVLMMVR